MAKAAAKKAPAKQPAKKAPTKSETFQNIADATELSKKQVAAVFDALNAEVQKALSKKGPGLFQIPGLCKIKLKRQEAQKERQGTDPFTGQPKTFKAKPAMNKVRVIALKNLKDMAPPAGR